MSKVPLIIWPNASLSSRVSQLGTLDQTTPRYHPEATRSCACRRSQLWGSTVKRPDSRDVVVFCIGGEDDGIEAPCIPDRPIVSLETQGISDTPKVISQRVACCTL